MQDGSHTLTDFNAARPYVSTMRRAERHRSALVAYPDAGVRTVLMSALREDGWEAIGAHCGTEVIRWLSLAELGGRPSPTLLVLSPSLRTPGGTPISRAIAATIAETPILYLSNGDDQPRTWRRDSSSAVARWPLDIDDFRTIAELLAQNQIRS
jgi:hypothetical protein